eukprot:2386873-Pyramimonas_sp.AAC.2
MPRCPANEPVLVLEEQYHPEYSPIPNVTWQHAGETTRRDPCTDRARLAGLIVPHGGAKCAQETERDRGAEGAIDPARSEEEAAAAAEEERRLEDVRRRRRELAAECEAETDRLKQLAEEVSSYREHEREAETGRRPVLHVSDWSVRAKYLGTEQGRPFRPLPATFGHFRSLRTAAARTGHSRPHAGLLMCCGQQGSGPRPLCYC